MTLRHRPFSGVLGFAICSALAVLLVPGRGLAALEGSGGDSAPEKRLTLNPADADGDGRVTRTEWGQLMQRFSRLDTDHDAAVSLAELQAAATTSETPVILPLADTNGDGKLIRGEWTRLAQNFRRLDGNHDGALDLDELRAAAGRTLEAVKAAGSMPTLDGLWRGWIVEGRGEIPNAGTQIELAISGNQVAGREIKPQLPGSRLPAASANAVADLGMGTLVMTGNGRFGMLDAMYTTGPHSGQVCLGVFRREGDVLYWCASNRAGYRPDVFATGSGCWLMILSRQGELNARGEAHGPQSVGLAGTASNVAN